MERNIVITGCNRGIGLELARLYSQSGAKVYGLVRESSSELDELAEQVLTGFDVNDSVEHMKTITAALSDIDVLINNAGLFKNESWPVSDKDLVVIKEQFEVNTLGPLKVMSALESKLRRGALAAFTSSRMGSIADNTSGAYYGYRMSKAALNMAVKGLAHDLGPRQIKTLALHPGYVKTRMTDFQGDISPEEAARGLFKILESACERVSGSFWHSNGQELEW